MVLDEFLDLQHLSYHYQALYTRSVQAHFRHRLVSEGGQTDDRFDYCIRLDDILRLCLHLYTCIFLLVEDRQRTLHQPVGNVLCQRRYASLSTDAGPVELTDLVLNILTDLMIIFLPMPMLKSLQIRKKHKIALMAIFAIGSL